MSQAPYVVHSMEGRARLRHAVLADAAIREQARAALAAHPAVRGVETGRQSLLLSLAPGADMTAICRHLESAVPRLREVAPPAAMTSCVVCGVGAPLAAVANRVDTWWTKTVPAALGVPPRKLELRALLAAAGLCMGCAILGAGRAHVWCGGAFALLAGHHIWKRRKAI